jgi:sRNA-binding regulator protein Hfq
VSNQDKKTPNPYFPPEVLKNWQSKAKRLSIYLASGIALHNVKIMQISTYEISVLKNDGETSPIVVFKANIGFICKYKDENSKGVKDGKKK